MLQSLLFTSRKCLPREREDIEIERIVAVSRRHNAANGITGGLINTENSFAQLLEGPAVAIDELMSRITIDPRHADVRVLRIDEITTRQLPDWSMAYSGSWTYVAGRVERFVAGGTRSRTGTVEELVRLIIAFAKA